MQSLADNLTEAIRAASFRGFALSKTSTDPSILINTCANEYATGVNHLLEFIMKNPRVPIMAIHKAFLVACERRRINIVPVNIEPIRPDFSVPGNAPEDIRPPQETQFPTS